MSMTDSIADFLTRIRNANQANHEKVDIPFSKLKYEMVKIIKEEGFIKNYKVIEDKYNGVLRVFLKYGIKRTRVIQDLQRVSKPGYRRYTSADNIPRVLGGLGIAIISTSKGVMTDREARRNRVGGEVLCYIW